MMQDETRVEVVQGDHERAASYYCSRAMGGSKADELQRLIEREDAGDMDPLSLLFALHRLAFAAPPAGEREDHEPLFERVRETFSPVNYDLACKVIDTIRKASHPLPAEREAIAREVEAAIPLPGIERHLHGAYAAGLREAARIIRVPSSGRDGWQTVDSAPHACHVVAARFDEAHGEWIYAVVASPPSKPFTHWRMLPDPPAALLPTPPEGDAG